MWKKINDLLSNPKAGGNVNQRWFVFYMSCYETPRLVQHKGGNCFACDNVCLQYKSSSICSHMLGCVENLKLIYKCLLFGSHLQCSWCTLDITETQWDSLTFGHGPVGQSTLRPKTLTFNV